MNIFNYNARTGSHIALDYVGSVIGSPKFKTIAKGIALRLEVGDSITFTIPSSDIAVFISGIDGKGTYSINSITSSIDGFEVLKNEVVLSGVTSIVITATSGYVYLLGCYAFDEAISTTLYDSIFLNFQDFEPVTSLMENLQYPKPTDTSSEVDSRLGEDLVTEINFPISIPAGGNDNVEVPQISDIGSNYTISYIIQTNLNLSELSLSVNSSFGAISNLPSTVGFHSIKLPCTKVPAVSSWSLRFGASPAGDIIISDCSCKKQTGLLAHYNMNLSPNGVVTDISGNGKNGIAENVQTVKDGLRPSYRTTNICTIGTGSAFITTWSLLFRARDYKQGTFDFLFGYSSNRNILLNSVGNIAYRSSNNLYYVFSGTNLSLIKGDFDVELSSNGTSIDCFINGLFISSITPPSTEFILNKIWDVYNTSGYMCDITLIDVKHYNHAITPQEALAYHNSFQKLTLKDHTKYLGVGNTEFEGWHRQSGTGEIIEVTDDGGRPEKVINYDFSDGLNGWNNPEGNVVVINEYAVFNGISTIERLTQNVANIGETYIHTIKIEDYEQGYVYIQTSGSSTGWEKREANGTFTQVKTSTTTTLYVVSGDNFIGKIKIASVKEIPALIPHKTQLWKQIDPGVASRPSKWSHGEMELMVKRALISSSSFIAITSQTTKWTSSMIGGYDVRLISDGSLKLVKTAELVLFTTVPSYTTPNTDYKLKIARLQSEGVFKDIPTLQKSDLINSDYETFISNGRYGFSASRSIDGATYQDAGTENEISIVSGGKYWVQFNLKLSIDSSKPAIALRAQIGGPLMSASTISVEGINSMEIIATSTGIGSISFRSSSGVANYEVSNLKIQRIYPAHTFAIFIRGGQFGLLNEDKSSKWTLVDTTGGSGSNPIMDDTYLTSDYINRDLDAGDVFGMLTTRNQVEQ